MCVCVFQGAVPYLTLNVLRNLNKRVLKLILGCHVQLVRAGPYVTLLPILHQVNQSCFIFIFQVGWIKVKNNTLF